MAGGWELAWTTGSSRTTLPLGSNGLGESAIGLAVSGSPEVPHILYVRQFPAYELAYATKGQTGLSPVSVAPVNSGAQCAPPTAGGQTCTLDYVTSKVEDVVGGGGEVRLIYSQRRFTPRTPLSPPAIGLPVLVANRRSRFGLDARSLDPRGLIVALGSAAA